MQIRPVPASPLAPARRRVLGALAALAALALAAGCRHATSAAAVASPVPAAPAPLRVMSFNLRYDTPSDGANAWPYRRDRVAALLRFHGADVVGVQEALAPMLADLDARLPGFARVGVGRADGRAGGEFSAILYRTDRLALLDSGTFWLSPTPEAAGSKGWDAAIERVATWARLRDRATGCAFLHLNTHFDHVGERARQESARLIRRRLATLSNAGAGALPVVVTGDLNADPESAAYRALTRDAVADAVPPLVDAFAASRTGHYGPNSTWTAFRAIEPGRRIDYVLVSARVPVWAHGVLTDAWDGRYPSDHLPVVAAVSPPCA